MAIYHLSATAVQRSKGHSAVAGAAYRSGSVLHDAMTEQTHDYQRKRGIVHSEIIAPDNAPAWTHDRQELWNRAELAEKRKDAQPAREVRLGLPHELTDEERTDLVCNFARDVFVGSGMVADVSIHRPDRHGDERNHHAHIYLTMRELDGEGFSAKKQRDWNRKETLEHWREKWAEYQNDALEDAGFDARVDHRTLEAQGIDRAATKHLGKDASAIEREGKASRIGEENREIIEHNQNLDQIVNELAEIDAEIERELAARFSDIEAHPEPETFSFPTSQASEPEPPLSWSEVQKAAQSPFNNEVTRKLNESREETGEVKEYGLGHNWYDRTTAMWENLYGTIEEHVTRTVEAVQGYWQRFTGRDNDEPKRSSWQQFTGKGRDEREPEEYERDR